MFVLIIVSVCYSQRIFTFALRIAYNQYFFFVNFLVVCVCDCTIIAVKTLQSSIRLLRVFDQSNCRILNADTHIHTKCILNRIDWMSARCENTISMDQMSQIAHFLCEYPCLYWIGLNCVGVELIRIGKF